MGRYACAVAGLVALLAAAPVAASQHEDHHATEPMATATAAHDHGTDETATGESARAGRVTRLVIPLPDARAGMRLFVTKGCVACHSVNGVGGHDATPLDAHTMDAVMSPLDFAAKMWRGAAAMIYAQEEALGAQIEFTGDELGDIVAFMHDDALQHTFTEGNLTPEALQMMDHQHADTVGNREDEEHAH
jgi:cytochrome c